MMKRRGSLMINQEPHFLLLKILVKQVRRTGQFAKIRAVEY